MKLYSYQEDAWIWAVERLKVYANKGVALFIDPGLGKTIVALKTFQELRGIAFPKDAKLLVIAPLRVAHLVWPQEIKKWGLKLTHQVIHGPKKAKQLDADVDVYITNPDTLKFLCPIRGDKNEQPPLPFFGMIVCDESTMFKTWTSKRSRRVRELVKRVPKVMILTGTPATEGPQDLFGQVHLLDSGAALGKNITAFRSRFCQRGGYMGRKWLVRKECVQEIHDLVSPLAYRLDAKDHLALPQAIKHVVDVELPADVLGAYKTFERDMFIELIGCQDLIADSAGKAYLTCRGIANGGFYMQDREAHHLHNAKVGAIKELLAELNGKPMIVAYTFNHDLERLQAAFPKAPVIRGGTNSKQTKEIMDSWRSGVLLCQPKAMSHGIDGLQKHCRDIAFFGMPDSLDVYQQCIARLHRTGGSVEGVRVHHLVATDTIDEMVYARLQRKDKQQQTLLDALRAYRETRWTGETNTRHTVGALRREKGTITN